MGVEVTFCVDLGEDCVAEQDMEGHWDELESSEYPHTGEVRIAAPGQPEVAIPDELWAVVLGVCFKAVPPLTAGQRFDYRHMNAPCDLILVPDGQLVRIEGDVVAAATVPRAELLPALVGAGDRFLTLMRRLPGRYANIVGTLEPVAERARAAL